MEISLKGRSAIITGASKGLGLAMATRFAASGADVAILARNPDGLEDVSTFPNLVAELMQRGWSDSALKKLVGGNLLRTLRGVEKAAEHGKGKKR